MPNKYLPININTRHFKILMVGGGKVALRKIETLIDFEADITVIAPEPIDKVEYFASKNRIKLEKRAYASPESKQYDLVISASDREDINRQVYDDCQSNGTLVNVVDNPALCTFIFPAMMKRESLSIAVSTDGKAPFLAAHLRLIMENLFPEHWNKIARLAGNFRQMVQDRWKDNLKERLASFDRFLEADWKSLIKIKNETQLQEELNSMLEPEYDQRPENIKDNGAAK